LDVDALEARAERKLDRPFYDYFAGGSEQELTLADNLAAWSRFRLRPRTLRGLGAIDASTTVLGTPVPAPILVAPMAMQRLACADGEVALGRATAAAGTVMVVPMMGTTEPDEVIAASPEGRHWLQVYLLRDRGRVADIVQRAAAGGCRALVLTVDTVRQGTRSRDVRNRFALPDGVGIPNAMAAVGAGAGQAESVAIQFDDGIGLDDIGWLREVSGLPVVVKGVLRGDDARECVDAGASGISVSNHGGRQLDGVVATADALVDVVDAVGGDAEVYVDGGVRRGTDVVRALALGAQAVLVGRPVVWGLVDDGAAGAEAVLRALFADLERAMALCGASSVDQLTPDLLA
jgi:4-hydroxymandelate oxidase